MTAEEIRDHADKLREALSIPTQEVDTGELHLAAWEIAYQLAKLNELAELGRMPHFRRRVGMRR